MRSFITYFNCQLKHMQNFHKQILKPLNPVLCVPTRETVSSVMSSEGTTSLATEPFEAKISLTTPVSDYKELIQSRVEVDEYVMETTLQDNFRKIAAAAQETIWNLLFGEGASDPKATAFGEELLKVHKIDARFHSPWEYNTWIVKLRDELLKREMLTFWKDVIVKHELGPCSARDSDYFDSSDDIDPAKFYEYGGCVAPFASDNKAEPTSTSPEIDIPATNSISVKNSTATEPFEANISLSSPLNDYKKLMDEKVLVDEYVNEQILQNNFRKIAAAMQDAIWNLLFGDKPSESLAEELLKAHKIDARFHSPWEYNTWIVKVRDELLKREMLTFWKDVIVKHELGPCSARDSDYFDSSDDIDPAKFYEYGGCVAPFSTAN